MKPAAAFLLASSVVLAAPLAHAHGVHEHGVSHLDVILDGPLLVIDLRAAGHHLAGFEHAPETAEQHAAWQATVDGLGDAHALFVLAPEAGCALQAAEVTAPTPTAAAHGHAPHDADWRARYRFECADAGRLTAIEVGLFSAFPAHEEVRYQRLSGEGQDGGTLTPGRTRLPLR